MSDRARLFVAAWPPAEVLDALEAIPRRAEPGVRYLTRQQWHVTLRFLGSCSLTEARKAFGAIRAEPATAELGPALTQLGRSVLVVPVLGLDALAAAVADATGAVGDPPDPRPFRGHLTVARLRERRTGSVAGHPFAATFAVRELHLVRSVLSREGASYETEETLELAG